MDAAGTGTNAARRWHVSRRCGRPLRKQGGARPQKRWSLSFAPAILGADARVRPAARAVDRAEPAPGADRPELDP